jgi:hypothetical protein
MRKSGEVLKPPVKGVIEALKEPSHHHVCIETFDVHKGSATKGKNRIALQARAVGSAAEKFRFA